MPSIVYESMFLYVITISLYSSRRYPSDETDIISSRISRLCFTFFSDMSLQITLCCNIILLEFTALNLQIFPESEISLLPYYNNQADWFKMMPLNTISQVSYIRGKLLPVVIFLKVESYAEVTLKRSEIPYTVGETLHKSYFDWPYY